MAKQRNEFLFSTRIHNEIKELKRRHKELYGNRKRKVLRWQMKMLRANVPREFWHIDFANFFGDKKARKMVKKYCGRLSTALESGFGFIFCGANGVGKTTLQMLILKEALKKGYTAFHITLPEIFEHIYMGFEDREVQAELRRITFQTQFLAIGELGKDYHRATSKLFAKSQFDSIFRTRRGMCKPTSMDTNLMGEELEDTYGDSIMSLFMSRQKIVMVEGRDFREKVQQDDWSRFME